MLTSEVAALPARVCDELLELQGIATEPLAAYVYDLDSLEQHCRRLRNALPPGVELFYAIKANAELPILQAVRPHVHGFEAASGGELQLLLRQFPDTPMLFGGPGKTPGELEAAVSARVSRLHVESLWELEQLGRIAVAPTELLLRLNPELHHGEDSAMLMAGKPTPFGLSESDLERASELLRSFPPLRCLGFHLHTRSLQLDPTDHLRLLQFYLERAPGWAERVGIELQELNVGGGIGVNYRHPEQQFPWESFCARLGELPRPCRLRFECGRFVSGFCGYYAVEVLDLKRNHGETFAVCRGGTHHFRLPAAQGHSHPFAVLPGVRSRGPSVERTHLNVVGQLCTPKDRLASGVFVERVQVGDLLVFPLAGAYAWNISHHDFLMHPPPVQRFLRSSSGENCGD